MPRKAGAKLSPAQVRALGMLLERTGTGNAWLVSGQHAVTARNMFALERLGLCRVRDVRLLPGGVYYEAQITEAGKQRLEQHHAE